MLHKLGCLLISRRHPTSTTHYFKKNLPEALLHWAPWHHKLSSFHPGRWLWRKDDAWTSGTPWMDLGKDWSSPALPRARLLRGVHPHPGGRWKIHHMCSCSRREIKEVGFMEKVQIIRRRAPPPPPPPQDISLEGIINKECSGMFCNLNQIKSKAYKSTSTDITYRVWLCKIYPAPSVISYKTAKPKEDQVNRRKTTKYVSRFALFNVHITKWFIIRKLTLVNQFKTFISPYSRNFLKHSALKQISFS